MFSIGCDRLKIKEIERCYPWRLGAFAVTKAAFIYQCGCGEKGLFEQFHETKIQEAAIWQIIAPMFTQGDKIRCEYRWFHQRNRGPYELE